MDNKTCIKCKLLKSTNKFNKNKCKKDGFDNWCKKCRIEYNNNRKEERQEYRKNNIEHIKKVAQKYGQSKNGKLNNAKNNANRRGLGFNLKYNNIFKKPFAYHHMNKNDVVTITEDIHQLYVGNGFNSTQHRFMIKQIINQLYRRRKKL